MPALPAGSMRETMAESKKPSEVENIDSMTMGAISHRSCLPVKSVYFFFCFFAVATVCTLIPLFFDLPNYFTTVFLDFLPIKRYNY